MKPQSMELMPSNPVGLKTIIHLVHDLSAIGGISGRVRRTVSAARGREIQHVCLSARHDLTNAEPGTLYAEEDEAAVLAFLSARHATDTVVLTPNNTIRSFSPAIREQLGRLPILHMASGQLSFMLQDSEALASMSYLDRYRVSRVLCLSDLDMSFHRQMGIYDVTKVRLPVATRSHNTYSPDKNRFATYVGRIDFHAKGADRLIPVARLMKERGLPPLHIFTTDGRNSPDLPVFLDQLAKAGLSDWVRITYNVTDKPTLYDQASVVLLPSRKEAFGNVILEAFSFGVPVIAPSYAPGPAEIICSGQDGYLLEEYTAEAVVDLLEGLSKDKLAGLSQAAFARHREYSMEQYLASLEAIAAEVAQTFPGRNEVRPFPHIKATEVLANRLNRARQRLDSLNNRISAMEASISWRITAPLRSLRARLNQK